MKQHRKNLSPNPKLHTEPLSGSTMNEPLVRLLTHQIDSLTVDGHRLVGVNVLVRSLGGTATLVSCVDGEGGTHVFTFGSGEDTPVEHYIIPKESRPYFDS